ncbi:DUF1656 domain-containing protein [Acinetobacter sp. ANC 4648]|uniref:DUF1656 domain-containing protein n=1 Tax=Acinetobacter sp. ANC 4648 TaxID=1977875 RepID=UPI000A348458|nr:DUF1656 domain-containing protein [Acinetobacter sp. ANC 4648]OTG80724.1 hypothetical protein B9T27_12730 [Acinetobacter sp. ANC 4648]
MGELNIYGVYVPVFLIQAILAYILFKVVTLVTDQWIAKAWIAAPGIFHLCIYIILLGLVHWFFILGLA